MVLDLDLSYSQSNDGTILTITDVAGTYSADNLTGWGNPNPEPTFVMATSIVSGTDTASYTPDKYHLKLNVIVTDKAGTETTYDQIDLYDHNGGAFTLPSDLTWDFTPADFVESSTAMGVATDKLTDGVYAIVYKLVDNDDNTVVEDTVSESILVDGDVRFDVYNKLRQVPVDYDNENNDKSSEIMEALLANCYLRAINAGASVSMTEELYTQLYTLDKIVSDGSKYTW